MEETVVSKNEKPCGGCKRKMVIALGVFFGVASIAVWLILRQYQAYVG
jgi:hypothetical protein